MSKDMPASPAQMDVRLAEATLASTRNGQEAAEEGPKARGRGRGRLPTYTEEQVEQVCVLHGAGHSINAIRGLVTPRLNQEQVRSIVANPGRARTRARLAAACRAGDHASPPPSVS